MIPPAPESKIAPGKVMNASGNEASANKLDTPTPMVIRSTRARNQAAGSRFGECKNCHTRPNLHAIDSDIWQLTIFLDDIGPMQYHRKNPKLPSITVLARFGINTRVSVSPVQGWLVFLVDWNRSNTQNLPITGRSVARLKQIPLRARYVTIRLEGGAWVLSEVVRWCCQAWQISGRLLRYTRSRSGVAIYLRVWSRTTWSFYRLPLSDLGLEGRYFQEMGQPKHASANVSTAILVTTCMLSTRSFDS